MITRKGTRLLLSYGLNSVACGHVALKIHGSQTQFCNTLHEGIHLRRRNFVTISTPEQDLPDLNGVAFRTFLQTLCIYVLFHQEYNAVLVCLNDK
jgi:hypothetical protein